MKGDREIRFDDGYDSEEEKQREKNREREE